MAYLHCKRMPCSHEDAGLPYIQNTLQGRGPLILKGLLCVGCCRLAAEADQMGNGHFKLPFLASVVVLKVLGFLCSTCVVTLK